MVDLALADRLGGWHLFSREQLFDAQHGFVHQFQAHDFFVVASVAELHQDLSKDLIVYVQYCLYFTRIYTYKSMYFLNSSAQA